jgi:hypothetical protein
MKNKITSGLMFDVSQVYSATAGAIPANVNMIKVSTKKEHL